MATWKPFSEIEHFPIHAPENRNSVWYGSHTAMTLAFLRKRFDDGELLSR